MIRVNVITCITSAVGTGPSPTWQSNTNNNFFSKYNMPKDDNYHCLCVWSYNNENVLFTSDCLVYVYKTY